MAKVMYTRSKLTDSHEVDRVSQDVSFTARDEVLLLPFLLEQLSSRGRNKVKSLLTRKQVSVDGHLVSRHDYILHRGQIVTVHAQGFRPAGWATLAFGLKLLYEDDDIIVVDKPPGLLTIATDKEKERTAYRVLMDHVQQKDPASRVFIVHRLDKETSGVMMFAKSEKVKRDLQDNWTDVVSERSYVAVVEGHVGREQGTIETWLKETSTQLMYVSPHGVGDLAVTHYHVLQRTKQYSLLRITLQTGRKNQIRVHMQHIGHSVAGDKRYGAKTNPLLRHALHAQILALIHPVTKRELRFETAIPSSFLTLTKPV